MGLSCCMLLLHKPLVIWALSSTHNKVFPRSVQKSLTMASSRMILLQDVSGMHTDNSCTERLVQVVTATKVIMTWRALAC